RGRHTRFSRDWSSDVCSSDLITGAPIGDPRATTSATAPPSPASSSYPSARGADTSRITRSAWWPAAGRWAACSPCRPAYPGPLQIGRETCREGVDSEEEVGEQ